MSKLPIVAIVGRANVGKSSLFNRLVGFRQVIVADEPGTTRDSIEGRVVHDDVPFWIIDTAGMKTAEDDFELTIQDQIAQATDSADLILVVIEADVNISDEDRRVAKTALRSKKPVILVANKSDRAKHDDIDQFKKLGIKNQVLTSAMHDRGTKELLAQIADNIPKRKDDKADKTINVSILGRPNVGKSNLFNTMIKKQQSVVSDVAGTTRDVNRKTINYKKQAIQLMDTAGIRKSGKIERGVEKFSFLRTLAAIEESDICLLLMDINEPNTHLDQKIAGMVKEAGKGLIIVVTKWDTIEGDEEEFETLRKQIIFSFQHVPWSQLIFTSSVTGKNVAKLFELFVDIDMARQLKIETKDINKWLKSIQRHHLPAGLKNTHPSLKYATQVDTSPPTFRVFGRDTKFLHWSYKRFMDRELREVYDLVGTPVVFEFIDGPKDEPKVSRVKPMRGRR